MSKFDILHDLDDLQIKIQSLSLSQNTKDKDALFEKIENLVKNYTDKWTGNEEKLLEKIFVSLADISLRHLFAEYINPSVFWEYGEKLTKSNNERLVNEYLDIFRSPEFLKRIYDDNRWVDLILKLFKYGG